VGDGILSKVARKEDTTIKES